MPALPLKVLNPLQFLGPAERFRLLPHPRIGHMAEQSGINHILIPLPVGWGDHVALPLLRGGDHGLEPLPREVILVPGHLNGVGPGLHRGGEDLEAPNGVAALDPLSDRVGPGAEIPREEAGLGQQGEADHTLDPPPPGADLVLEHQLGGVGPGLEHLPGGDHDPEHRPGEGPGQEHQPVEAGLGQEHLLGADLGPDHQYEGDLAADLQPGEVVGHVLEPQLDGADHVLEPQLDAVAAHALEPQLDAAADHALEPQLGEGGLGLEPQQDEDPAVEVWLGEEDLTLGRHKEEAGLVPRQSGRTNPEHLRGGAGPTQVQK